jgi:hypothetical protein
MEFKEVLNKLVEGKNLTEEESSNLFNRIMEGKLPDVQIAGTFVALRAMVLFNRFLIQFFNDFLYNFASTFYSSKYALNS